MPLGLVCLVFSKRKVGGWNSLNCRDIYTIRTFWEWRVVVLTRTCIYMYCTVVHGQLRLLGLILSR